MQRNKSSNNWIVQKLIDRDHMNHHYRRLNSAQSHLHLNKRTVTFSKNRLSKSNNDVRFEDQLRGVERQMESTFCLDVTPHPSEKKKEISDESTDIVVRHSQYFTHPAKQFTPRVLRKIVRPNSSSPNRLLSNSRPVSSQIRPVNAVRKPVTPRKAKKVFIPADQRNVSDDSAYGDEHSTDTSTESTIDSQGLAAFNIKMWLKEQEEENRYMQLMCDITADLLQRNLCTNGAIKEIIAIYIRKSKKKFSIGTNVLMKRLCEDLMIPSDNGLDEQYYGSRYTTGSNYSYRSRQTEESRNHLKEFQTLDHFPNSSNDTGQNDRPSKKNHRYEQSGKPTSYNKPNNLELEGKELGLLEEKKSNSLKNEDMTKVEKNQRPSQLRVLSSTSNQKTDVVNVPEVEGYFSDFTNDTDNDIEEEFDFD